VVRAPLRRRAAEPALRPGTCPRDPTRGKASGRNPTRLSKIGHSEVRAILPSTQVSAWVNSPAESSSWSPRRSPCSWLSGGSCWSPVRTRFERVSRGSPAFATPASRWPATML